MIYGEIVGLGEAGAAVVSGAILASSDGGSLVCFLTWRSLWQLDSQLIPSPSHLIPQPTIVSFVKSMCLCSIIASDTTAFIFFKVNFFFTSRNYYSYRVAPGGLRWGSKSLASGRVQLQERMHLHVNKNQF